MVWGRIDDAMCDNAKITAAGNAAVGAWARLISWSCRQGTDGLVPAQTLKTYANRAELSRLRVTGPTGYPLVHAPGERCRCLPGNGEVPAGWYGVHDFAHFNERAAEVAVRRARKNELRDPALRLAVRTRDQDLCRYCGVPTEATGPRRLVLDHVDPRVVSGATNLVVACHACNAMKGNRTPAEAGMTLLAAPSPNERSTMARTIASGRAGAGTGRAGAGTRVPSAGTPARTRGPGANGLRDRLMVTDRTDHSGQPHWRQGHDDDAVPDWPPVDAESIP